MSVARNLEISLPATSANLGPAFDAAALALGLVLHVSAQPSDGFSVTTEGRDAELCSETENNLILETYREVLAAAGKAVPPLALQLRNEIPVGKGCGSSAAARLAGIALAVRIGHLDWTDQRIIAEAAWREGHPDNAAACWLGGLAIARIDRRAAGDATVHAVRLEASPPWPLLLAIPQAPLPTEEARRVLPAHYSRRDAVRNVQNSLLLLTAFVQGRSDLLRAAINDDRIHEPYRAPLCPLLPALRELIGQHGVLGAVLSGAGPAVLIFLDEQSRIEAARTAISAFLAAAHLSAEVLATSIASRGGRDSFRSSPQAVAR